MPSSSHPMARQGTPLTMLSCTLINFHLNSKSSIFIFKNLLIRVSQILKLLKIYIIINFRVYLISRDTRKLARTPTLIKKKRCSTAPKGTVMANYIIILYFNRSCFLKYFLFRYFLFKNISK